MSLNELLVIGNRPRKIIGLEEMVPFSKSRITEFQALVSLRRAHSGSEAFEGFLLVLQAVNANRAQGDRDGNPSRRNGRLGLSS